MAKAKSTAPKKAASKAAKDKSAARTKKEFDRDAEETALIKKYPKQKIKPGSLKDVGEVQGFGNKRTIVIFCQGTGKERRIATSDLHQVKYCEEYIKQLRLERRKELRASKSGGKKKAAPKASAKKASSGKRRTRKKPAAS